VTEQQWIKIYRETVHPLYGYTARRTGGIQELTEDIVQESYLRALDNWKQKSMPESPLAWLKRVARNILIDFLRQKKWESKVNLNNVSDAGQRTPRDQIKSLEMFLAISSLGKKKAGILEAFYFDGRSVREIADMKKISERAVEGQLRRARQSLKTILPEQIPQGGNND
jgi:RNA polymerase sigma-70 factor (ECF subfamily)